jgi:hypothetical protein
MNLVEVEDSHHEGGHARDRQMKAAARNWSAEVAEVSHVHGHVHTNAHALARVVEAGAGVESDRKEAAGAYHIRQRTGVAVTDLVEKPPHPWTK